MSRVYPDKRNEALVKCHYQFPQDVISDVSSVQAAYRDLHLYIDFYCYANGEKKQLVNLSGTVPILYEGKSYNIPVCIWLHNTHPQNPPKCFVNPSACMVINANSSYVDKNGHVRLHYLCNWKHGTSNLLGVVEEMRTAFQSETPLFSALPSQGLVPSLLQPGNTKPIGYYEPSRKYIPDTSTLTYSGTVIFDPNTTLSQSMYDVSPVQCSTDTRKHVRKPEQSSQHEEKKSYATKLMDLGIAFQPAKNKVCSSSIPSEQNKAEVPAKSPTCAADVDDVFKSLELENIINIYKLGTKENDAERVARKEEHVLTLNNQKFPLQVKKYERPEVNIPIPEGVSKEKSHIFQSLLTLDGRSFSVEDVMEAVQSSRDYDSALRYLSHECPICSDQVSFNKIVTMTYCSCAICEGCFKAYFSSVIKEKSIVNVVCPICNMPNVNGSGCTEDMMDYFNLLDIQIRHYLEPEIHELFQRKLRDRTLQEMPNFRWCAHCSFGLLHEADRLRMDCPSCGKSTCYQCKSPWAPQHEGITCEKFREWQLYNNPEYQADRLEHFLSRNEIDCPNCTFRFYLSKGGCLHFKCTQCQHEFCGGCNKPFRVGSACSFSKECHLKGLHAHHPRNCLYHLRDWPVKRLQQLLRNYNIPYSLENRAEDKRSSTGMCTVLEHKETSDGVVEEQCGRRAPVLYSGYCKLHYKEYLVELINNHSLDPAVMFTIDEIATELQRWKLSVPEKMEGELAAHYQLRLRRKLIQEVKLMPDKRNLKKTLSGLSSTRFPESAHAASTERRQHDLLTDLQLLVLNE
ncbi:E3 ubiquitin-protein ligase RNF31 isoform X2 [Lepisosteus oculatus]|uniref:E3 ubiquitin-protein ligase RNF31 isoform X2 n=1 Tax=Lepisosteus oculatus TaxID=7918 RepID=UPI00073FAFFB|nr:PREDICTED: E3 ubiquitin-protein ligase RNF31-like isoform X3 [Lepisosteus oculatus]